MKKIKFVLIAAFSVAAFTLPFMITSHSQAAGPLTCNFETTEGCDLGLTKQVSINGSDFVSTETPDAAPQAKVGDTITWEITISNLSDPDNVPFGVVTVQDILPSEFTMGTNAPSAGGYSDGNWTFTLDSDTPTYTLTITGIAQTSGIIDNVATLTNYDPNNCGEDGSVGLCGGDPGYGDSNSTNDSDQAYVNIASIPVSVVTTSSVPLAPNTGFTVGYTSPWQDLAFYSISAASLFGLAYVTRRFTRK